MKEEKKTDSEQNRSTPSSLNLLKWVRLQRRQLHIGVLVLPHIHEYMLVRLRI
jgi:hypothetical protein